MYQVALCEDDQVFADAHEKTCRAILKKLNIEHQISVFLNGADFLSDFMKYQKRYDLILLDIVMDGIDGMELARKIRQADKNAAIIFITSNESFALQGYDVNALHYLIKPVDEQKLESLISSAYAQQVGDDVLIVKMGDQHLRVPLKDIVCLETVGRRVEISLIDKTIYSSGKLADILNELPKGQFVRCHQSYAVNIKNIRGFTRRNAISVTGKEIPVSYTYLDDTRKAFLMQIDVE